MRIFEATVILAAVLIWAGCGSQEKPAARVTERAAVGGDEEAIRLSLIESLGRVAEGDKTVMYENEFSYYRAETPLAEYMEFKGVKAYKPDSLRGVEIDSVHIIGDTARAFCRMKYETGDGSIKEVAHSMKLFRNLGRWIRPYISKWETEREYLEQKRIYDSVTAGQ